MHNTRDERHNEECEDIRGERSGELSWLGDTREGLGGSRCVWEGEGEISGGHDRGRQGSGGKHVPGARLGWATASPSAGAGAWRVRGHCRGWGSTGGYQV